MCINIIEHFFRNYSIVALSGSFDKIFPTENAQFDYGLIQLHVYQVLIAGSGETAISLMNDLDIGHYYF